jgi:hypothetical protein
MERHFDYRMKSYVAFKIQEVREFSP